MKWISLGDEHAHEILDERGISWELTTPRELNPDDVFVHPKRLQRLTRIGGGLGGLTVASATIDTPMNVSGAMNPDGTLSITSAQRKARTSQGAIGQEEDNLDVFRRINGTFYRPHGFVDVDTGEIRNNLRNHNKAADPFAWVHAIDSSIKQGLVESSLKANVFNVTFMPDVLNIPYLGRPIFLGLAAMKIWLGYKGLEHLIENVSNQQFMDAAHRLVIDHASAAVAGGFYLKLVTGHVRLRDFKPSLIDPHMPLDRPLIAVAQRYMSAPVIKYQQ
jgi:hypothetical protein